MDVMTMGTTTFTDAASFLEGFSPLRDSVFPGSDLAHDPADRTMTLVLCHGGGHPGAGRGERIVVTVRGTSNYRQSLTHGTGALYILDRVEVGRGGHELSFYFRPGDRAVMDVERIEGSIERTGRIIPAPRRPTVLNPLAESTPRRGLLGRLLGR